VVKNITNGFSKDVCFVKEVFNYNKVSYFNCMRKGQKHNVDYLKQRRRDLRKQLTPSEATLWKHLQNRKLNNKKFTKQHSIENYIVDFYCPEEKLIIELDGEGHNNLGQVNYDEVRDNRLQELGFKLLRFENKLVFENLDYVLATISANFKIK
jgi:very-short-patch-repair endonuclease